MAPREIRERRIMAGLDGCLRHVAARAAFAALTAFAIVSSADAQWFPPLGAAPPSEIVQRLQAEGYVLIGPLKRNDTVYLAEVRAGNGGLERLVLDAWSGEILQRFVARRGSAGGYVVEGGEFNFPPPLAPPPAREFREGNVAYGEPGGHAEPAPRTKVKPKPAAASRKPAEPNPATAAAPSAQTVTPPEAAGNGNSANPSAAATVAPNGAPSPAAESATPAAQQPNAAPKSDASPASSPAAAQKQTKPSAPTSPAAAAKPGEKSKVNDVPITPLE
jgi:hypothetical protein